MRFDAFCCWPSDCARHSDPALLNRARVWVQNAATVAAGVLHWLPPGETVGNMLHPSGTCMATNVPKNLPEDVLKEYQHFSALLAVADKHFFKCESVSLLLRTLESASQPQSSSHARSCDAPISTGGAAEAAAQHSGRAPAPASRMQELVQDACRSVLLEVGRCVQLNV
jgi:hypothetical protein